eukprot:g3633.t1
MPQLDKLIKQGFQNQKLKLPAPQTIRKYVDIALNLKPFGLEALKDVTFLPGRPKEHSDRTQLNHKRVTLKLFERKEFQKMNQWEQAVYIYRLAKGSVTTNKQLSANQCKTLDDMAKTVGQEVARVMQIAPYESWSKNFKIEMRKLMSTGLRSRYMGQGDGLLKSVESFKKTLPDGMEPPSAHVDILLLRPHHTTANLFKADEDMIGKWEAFEAETKAIEQTTASKKASFSEKVKSASSAGAGAEKDKEETPASFASGPAASTSSSAPTTSSDDPSTASATPVDPAAASATSPEESTATGKTAEPTKADEKDETSNVVPSKRKRSPAAPKIVATTTANDERMAKLKKNVVRVQLVDPLSSTWNVIDNPVDSEDGSIMLAFLNVAGDHAVLDDTTESRGRLLRAVTEIAGKLDDRGTLAVAMESTASFNIRHIKGVMEEAGLALEAYPITSVYLSKLAGRTPADSKLHYTRQSSSVLLAHKTSKFTCHSSRPRYDPPRTSQLEAVGIVVSSKHPAATFLAHSMADHVLNRFTVAGDSVLVSAFEHNPLAGLVLGGGRRLCALVGDPAKGTLVADDVTTALVP